ncbi:MAG: type II toxin-antitoxin system RelE/ParE family toxin [Boseongicola sp.]|nr:type II toxin-antitoxin system RelE/ParE family toxin [Boseongicola sp.]
MTATCRLTPAALADLDTIADYTLSKWGADQMERYILQLTDRCNWLAQNPQAGRTRSDIHPDYFCYPQGKHLIFYLRDSVGISVIGFPHQSMDIVAYFDQ